MYKKQRNALLVFFALSLMVGCKEGSTQSKPLTLPEGKAKTVATKVASQSKSGGEVTTPGKLTISIKREEKGVTKGPQPTNPSVVTAAKDAIEKPLNSPNTFVENIESEILNIEPSTREKSPSPIPEGTESGVVTESTTLYPKLDRTYVAQYQIPSRNPSYVDNNVIAQIGKLKNDLGEENMGDEAFIRTVSAAMAKDKKGRLAVRKHKPQYTLQQVVTMCEIQRAYLSKTDFVDLTDVLIEKALEPLKDKKEGKVTGYFTFNYDSTAAGIVQYLGEKFKRDEMHVKYDKTTEQKLRDILQALSCLAYDSKNKSKISEADVTILRNNFNAIVDQHSTSQGLGYPSTTELRVRESQDFRATAPPESRQVSRSNTVILGSILEEPELSAQETVSILDIMRDDEDLESKYGDTTAATKGMVDKIVLIVSRLNTHKEEKLEGLDNPKNTEAAEKTLEAVNKFLEKACTTLYEDGEPTAYAISACHNVVTREDFQKALEAIVKPKKSNMKFTLGRKTSDNAPEDTDQQGDTSNRRLRKRLIALITGCVKPELLVTEDKEIFRNIQVFEKHKCCKYHRFNHFKLNHGSKLNKKVELESDKNKVFVEVKKDEELAGQHSRTETGTRVEVV